MPNSFRSKKEIESDKPTRYYSTIQEKSIADAVGGTRTKNSGATMFQPGDVILDNWILEAKTCTKPQKSFTLKEDWFIKNRDESLLANKEYMAVVFNFGPDKPNYYIIDEPTFKELLEYLENNSTNG